MEKDIYKSLSDRLKNLAAMLYEGGLHLVTGIRNYRKEILMTIIGENCEGNAQ